MKTLRSTLLCLLACLLFLPVFARGEDGGEAADLTAQCRMKFSSGDAETAGKAVKDSSYKTRWKQGNKRDGWVTAESEEQPIAGVYLCFLEAPETWELQVPENNDWKTVYTGDGSFLHVWVPLEESAMGIRLLFPAGKKVPQLATLRLYGAGSVPGDVQSWEPPVEDADILFLVAHPDDELIFLGGCIPTYAAEKQKKTAVCYMLNCGAERQNELLDGLWSMGVRNYPVMGPFREDMQERTLQQMYKALGGKAKIHAWIVSLYRRFKPEAVVTHDLKGEYLQKHHRIAAESALAAYDEAMDPEIDPESAEKYGLWQVQKLYHHLGEENILMMDWDVPLESLGGITGHDAAVRAFTYHVSQQGFDMNVENYGKRYDNEKYSLTRTEVGPDEEKNDFLEHITVFSGEAP